MTANAKFGRARRRLCAENLVQAFNDLGDIRRRDRREALDNALDGQGPDLADRRPGRLGKPLDVKLERQRKARFLRRACQSYRDDRAGPGVENVVTQDQRRPMAGPPTSPGRVQIRSANFASQYSGPG